MKSKTRLSAKQILLKAARLLIQKGWTRGEYKKHGRYCLFGAVNQVSTGNPHACSGTPARRKALAELRFRGFTAGWNDEPDRRKAQVIAALRETAKGLR